MSGRPLLLLPTDPAAWYFEPVRDALVRQGMREQPEIRLVGLPFLQRVVSKLGLQRNFSSGDVAGLGFTGWAGTRTLFPRGYWQESVLYGFDCWEPDWPRWARMLERNRVRFAMFSARTSAETLRSLVPGLRTAWIPEAIADGELAARPAPLQGRPIDLLDYGRAYAAFQGQAEAASAAAGRTHVFPRGVLRPGRTAAELRDQRRQSKAVVCFPRSDTHPESAGKVETVTLRYFEAMAAGALIVGRAPQELIDLFGYDPVVAVDVRGNVGEQLGQIFGNIGQYQELALRNHARMKEVGVWSVRVRGMLRKLEEEGYEVRGW